MEAATEILEVMAVDADVEVDVEDAALHLDPTVTATTHTIDRQIDAREATPVLDQS